MKVQFVIPMTLMVSVALVGVMRMRRKDHEKDDKRVRFQDIKLKVTNDVLTDYQNEMAEKQHTKEKIEGEQKTLEEQVVILQTKLDSTKGSANECQGNQVGPWGIIQTQPNKPDMFSDRCHCSLHILEIPARLICVKLVKGGWSSAMI